MLCTNTGYIFQQLVAQNIALQVEIVVRVPTLNKFHFAKRTGKIVVRRFQEKVSRVTRPSETFFLLMFVFSTYQCSHLRKP